MPYKRHTIPFEVFEGKRLTRAMAGIGMRFASRRLQNPNIEDTIFAASLAGVEEYDLRVLSVLVTWIEIHHPWINADRLTRIVSKWQTPRVRAFWTAIASWLKKDRRFSRMENIYSGPPVEILPTGTQFQVERRGVDPRFKETHLRVPYGVLRDRKRDIIKPDKLAQIHRPYHQRVLMGPTYRADMWACLEETPTLTCAELARLTYGSFATAWQVKHDYEILAA